MPTAPISLTRVALGAALALVRQLQRGCRHQRVSGVAAMGEQRGQKVLNRQELMSEPLRSGERGIIVVQRANTVSSQDVVQGAPEVLGDVGKPARADRSECIGERGSEHLATAGRGVQHAKGPHTHNSPMPELAQCSWHAGAALCCWHAGAPSKARLFPAPTRTWARPSPHPAGASAAAGHRQGGQGRRAHEQGRPEHGCQGGQSVCRTPVEQCCVCRSEQLNGGQR